MSTVNPTRSHGWIGRTVAVVAVLAAAVGAVVVWASPVLGLKSIQVQGPAAAELGGPVREAVELPTGMPLARIDLAAVRQRVLTVGAVKSATVRRQWPNTVLISVTERVAVATTEANGRWWLVDATGLPFKQVDARPTDLMPLELATPGPHDRATTAAIAVLRSLTPALRGEVHSIVAPSAYDVTLSLADGRTVIWGSAGSSALAATKIRVLEAMLHEPGSEFDISDPTLVTVRGD